MIRKYGSLLLVFMLISGCQSKHLINEVHITKNAEDVQLITSDIPLFWKMYDREVPLVTPTELKEEYIHAGTTALSLFYDEKIKSPDAYTDLLNSWYDRQYYEDVREATLLITNHKNQIIKAFIGFKQLYTDAVFSDIVFVMGALNTGGVVLHNGQIVIAAEMFAKKPDMEIGYLNTWLQSVLRPPNDLPIIALHELIHVQQNRFAQKYHLPIGGRTLLDRALLEGGADFITHLVLGDFLNDHLLAYGDAHESQIWEQFSKEMQHTNYTGWLYNGHAATKGPADLGYYIGFKIAEKYYNQADDKQQAVKDIIEINNGKDFLKKSGYANSFK